jgi:3-oxoisoapionate decarboxylase
MTRRELLGAAVASTMWAGQAPDPTPAPRTTMGVTIDCYQFGRRRQPAYEFAEYCNSLGAGGVQVEMPADLDYARKLRRYLEEHGLFFDVMVNLPGDDDAAFDRQIQAAKEAGAFTVRAACLGGRRYEQFNSLDQWREFVRQSEAKVARAIRIAEKHRLPLCLENHKDWTVDELVALMKRYSSEYLAVCLDTGNNLSLLDDYMEVVERLAPYTLNTHLKDMSLAEYRDGLLLVEPVFGKGYFDLARIVSTVRKVRPASRFTVEMLTRDPLKVAVFTDKYWATFPERNGLYLARTMAAARAHGWQGPLPQVEQLDRDSRIQLEEDNVRKCLAYAREQLGMRA